MENGKWHYLKDDAVGMISDLERRLDRMTTEQLVIVTGRLTDIRLELDMPTDGGNGRVYQDLLKPVERRHENGKW
jgi:hypothetical protein